MDIVGKLPIAPGQRVYMIAVTDYFTKWVEVEVYHQVYDREVKNFIWKNVIYHFTVPKKIMTDNRCQWNGKLSSPFLPHAIQKPMGK